MNRPDRAVHHSNGDKSDNRPENLKPVTSLEHGAEHARFNIAEACRLYEQGSTLHELAARYGVHYVSVLRAIKRRGVVPRPARRRLIPIDVNQVIELFHQGYGLRRIAQRFGVSTEPIDRIFKLHHLRRGPGRVPGMG